MITFHLELKVKVKGQNTVGATPSEGSSSTKLNCIAYAYIDSSFHILISIVYGVVV